MKYLIFVVVFAICVLNAQAIQKLNLEKFQQDALKAHNKYRAQHGAQALELNDDLNTLAQAMANIRIIDETYVANLPKYQNAPIGANVCQTVLDVDDIIGSGQLATDSWYNGVLDYKTGSKNNINAMDFAQVVWKKTKYVGFGIAKSKPHGHYISVAFYFPAGNVEGEYESNVQL